MESKQDYSINTDIKYGYSKLIDIPEIIKSCKEQWFNQTLCQVNDSVVRIGIMRGAFHWHKHEEEDEFFYVIEGKLLLDLEGETIELIPKQGYTVPKGVKHRTRAKEKTVILMVEKYTVKPTGD
ncbi:MAG: cupin domain-containing protein [Promethearchaeota archaeon]